MLIKKKLLAALIMLSFVAFSACSDDKDPSDTTGPTITLESPNKGDTFHRGKDIHIEFDLEDEDGINNYKVDIHWGEGHDHRSSAMNRTSASQDVAWSYQKVYDDKKGQKNAHVHIHTNEIPDNAKLGEYHFGILATDISGNESRKYISIQIVE